MDGAHRAVGKGFGIEAGSSLCLLVVPQANRVLGHCMSLSWAYAPVSCPGRGAAFFMPLRRAGTVPSAGVRDGPGSAAHHAVKDGALRCVWGTKPALILSCHTPRRNPRAAGGLSGF